MKECNREKAQDESAQPEKKDNKRSPTRKSVT